MRSTFFSSHFSANQWHERASWLLWCFLLLAVAHLKSYCLARANILQSRGPLCQAWLWGYYKKGKSHLPQKPSSITGKRFSPSIETVNGSHSSHLENINCCCFFPPRSLCWQKCSVTGAAGSFIVGLRKKGKLFVCMCFHILDSLRCCMHVLTICRAHVQLTCLWNISVDVGFVSVSFVTDVDTDTLPKCDWSIVCRIRSCFMLAEEDRSNNVTDRPEATLNPAMWLLGASSSFLGHKNICLNPKTTVLEISYICIPNIQMWFHDTLIRVDSVLFFCLRASSCFLVILGCFCIDSSPLHKAWVILGSVDVGMKKNIYHTYSMTTCRSSLYILMALYARLMVKRWEEFRWED